MREWLHIAGWLACVIYSTIPLFWMMIHPFADWWRDRQQSPYRVLVPAWLAMWAMIATITLPFRNLALYDTDWAWIPTGLLVALGSFVYSRSNKTFGARQLVGLPEVHGNNREQRLVTDGIRARVRHPVYLAHLCEMLAWSVGTGLTVCWGLTAFAITIGAVMIRSEDAELEKRFGAQYVAYRKQVPVLPRLRA
jgi:protein-S-isoprenylcysteine O-methyltransferase Ste14